MKPGTGFGSVFGACLTLTLAASAQDRQTPLLDSPIEVGRLAEHIKVLASDAFEGRGPATRAEGKTLDYLIAQLEAAGVKPGGEHDGKGGRRWTQDVPLAQSDIQGVVRATVRSDSASFLFDRSGTLRLERRTSRRTASRLQPLLWCSSATE